MQLYQISEYYNLIFIYTFFSDIGILTAESLEFCTSSCYMKEHLAPLYRCLVRFPEVRLDMKQPPIMLHKKLNKYIPSFTAIYEEVIAPSSQRLDAM